MSESAVQVPVEPGEAFPVAVSVDLSQSLGTLNPFWRFFGADEPNYAILPDGKKLLGELGKIGRTAPAYFRAHNLLTTGDGKPALKWGSTNAYTEDADGSPVYDWTIVDGIFDTYLARGVKPYVQIGFMPEALSIKPHPYRHHWTPQAKYDEIYTGWAYPPSDYAKWGELVYQWARHCVERYGRAEVETWYWQVWNEPNMGYWRGTTEEFYQLHDHAIEAVRRALPTARVGGPDTAGGGGKWLTDFLTHCVRGTNAVTGKTGTPTDFTSFHAKGSPTFVDGHVRMGIANQLRDIDRGFAVIAGFPELKHKPIVIGESDPDGCAACQGPQLGYRNGTMYSSYTAASFARKYDLAAKHGVNLEGAVTWAFEFEEEPLFAGFRVLATGGIDLPVLNVFRMFALMGKERIAAQSTSDPGLETLLKDGVRDAPDVSAFASRHKNQLTMLLWHYHDDDLPGPDAAVSLQVSEMPAGVTDARLTHYRIDETHSNAFSVWKNLGSPAAPDADQYRQLEEACQLARLKAPDTVAVKNGESTLEFRLPRQAVSLVVLDLYPDTLCKEDRKQTCAAAN
jgi:xylan 1,4-beta-xylosidase